MVEVVARCPDCGTEQLEAFANCFVCMKPSRWWCVACREWRPTRACPACAGGIGVPAELFLGSCTVGSTIAFKVTARNSSKKLLSCEVRSPDPGVAITNPRLLIPASGSIDVRGGITLPPGPLGQRIFRLSFDALIPTETVLVVEAMAAAPRLDFLPAIVVLRTPNPGSTVRTSVALKNTGNVSLTANLSTSARWIKTETKQLTLAPGESAQVKLRAGSKKTDTGTLEAKLTANAPGGPYSALVRYILPDPEVMAEPVIFGELRPGRTAFAEVTLRNVGRVRVTCTVAPAHAWLRILPTRVNLPPGREKKIRVRALLTATQDGPQRSELLVSSETGVLLRVPVSAIGKVPKGVLRSVRKQRLRNAIGPPVERKFQVANDGDGRLDVSATTDKPWVRVLTPELRVAPGKKRKLRYVLDLPVLPRGEHSATIALTSNGGNATVPVTVHILDPNPVLEVLPTPELGLIMPEVPLSAFVQVRNAGIGLLHVQAESENPRVSVTPSHVDVSAGPPVRFNLMVPVEGLAGGEHEFGVRFTSNGGDGRAAIRFRLPVERIDVPAMIDLGERPAGRASGGAVRVRNIGPDRVTLRVRGEDQGLRPGTEWLSLLPGETVSVPFRMELPASARGPVTSAILIEGRLLRHAVAVRVIARKVELIVVPGTLILGDLTPGTERAFAVDVVNAGEVPAEIRATHIPGELEVWLRRAYVQPGERVTLAGRVRVNATQTYREISTVVSLTDEATLRCVVRVVPQRLPSLTVLAVAAAVMTLGAIAASNGLRELAGVLIGILALAWLLWRMKG